MTHTPRILLALPFAGFLFPAMAPAAPPAPMPPNTIDCKDWKHLPDGRWQASASAKPFDVGDTKKMQIQDETIGPRDIGVGNYDLSDLLDRKCGGEAL
jgi:hypothetical protein